MFQAQRINRTQIAIIGFPGQTVLHRPASGAHGPDWRRPRVGTPARDPRRRAISGLPTWLPEGRAPLVALYHHALAATPDRAGCSSQHWPRRQRHLCRSERRCRYRSGNAPLDDFMHARTGKSAFAYRAVRMLQGVPITFPGTTGASPPTPGERRGSTLDRRSDVTGRLRRRCCRGHP